MGGVREEDTADAKNGAKVNFHVDRRVRCASIMLLLR